MSRPTADELDTALKKAGEMREQDKDEYYIAKSLLSHNYRIHFLEKVLTACEHYLHSGQGSKEHQILVKAISEAKKTESRPGDEPSQSGGDILL